MQKKFFLVLGLILMSTMFIFNSNAHAFGLGGYVTGSGGAYDWTYTNTYDDSEFEDSSSVAKFGVGFVLDTAVAKDKLFNYRLNVGYTAMSMTSDNLPDASGFDFHLYNDFGFGLVRTDSIRLCVGPQIGFGVLYGEYDVAAADDEVYDFATFFISLGAVAGLNIHASDLFTIGLESGFRVSSHAGSSDFGYPNGSDMSGTGSEVFANVSFIFKIKDTYSSAN